ncbi:hypothetical protein [Deinococcus misasensis]|uniref:sunset domain-containing protein n=1 Tax=Deinococcus misasensis TaxID=392413 RepID=UPI00055202EC|nr:hypothetical protein [Deinococcus misasensis]
MFKLWMCTFWSTILLAAGMAGAQGVPPASKTTCPVTHPIKGNLSRSGEKIYHLPTGAYYKRTHPEVCFRTPTEAQKAGFRASKR